MTPGISRTPSLVAIVAALFCTASASGQDRAAYQPIDPATIAAYEKLGATYGQWLKDLGPYCFADLVDCDGLPGFMFYTKEPPKTNLPEVSVPHMLHIYPFDFTAIEWGEKLAKQKNLTAVALHKFTGNAGLREIIQALPDLTGIGLYDIGGVNESGLKELTRLKKLRSIAIGAQKTDDSALATLNEAGLLLLLSRLEGENRSPAKSMKEVVALDLCFTNVSDEGLKIFADARNLRSLNLTKTKVTNASMKHVGGLTDLTELILDRTKVTGDGLKELANLTNLTRLDLSSCDVTDDGLKYLANFKKLKSLKLFRTKVTDAGLKHLTRLTELTSLSFDFVPITDRGLQELRELKRLVSLSLGNDNITDAGVKSLAELPNLTELRLWGSSEVTDIGVKHLLQLKNLTVLKLSGCSITDSGLKDLTALKNLRELWIRQKKATPLTLEIAAGFKNLDTLSLDNKALTEDGLRTLRTAGKLHILSLAETKLRRYHEGHLVNLRPKSGDDVHSVFLWKTHVNDAMLREIAASFKNLNDLELGETKITNAGLKELANLKSLVSLGLTKAGVTDAGLADLRPLQKLRMLYLDGTAVTDTGLRHLAELKELEQLWVNDTKVTSKGVRQLCKSLPNVFVQPATLMLP